MNRGMKSAIGASIVIQGLGSLPPFLTIIILARFAGPEVQGTFSAFKTYIDLATSLLIFGFPQAFVYLINKELLRKEECINFSIIYALCCSFFLIPILLIGWNFGYIVMPDGQSLLYFCLAIIFGGGAFIFNRLIRAVYLTIDDGVLFALITSAPAFMMLCAIVAAAFSKAFPYDMAYFATGIGTLLATAVWLVALRRDIPYYAFQLPTFPKRMLLQQSVQTFIQSLSFTIQPVLTISTILYFGGGVDQVAYFSASIMLIAAANVLFGIIAPILFNRWSKLLDAHSFANIQSAAGRVAIIFFILGLVGLSVSGFLVTLCFGPEYIGAVTAFQLMSLTMAPVAFTRTIYPAIHAAGRPDLNTLSCLTRVGTSWVVQLLLSFTATMSPLSAAVWAWLIAEWCAFAYTWVGSKRTQQELT